MMGHVTPAVPLLVMPFSVMLAPVLSSCNPDGPGNCYFSYNNSCGWVLGSGWRIQRRWANYALEFDDEPEGRVHSRLACSTGGSDRCLKFRYRFENDDEVDLNVIINSSHTSETVVWTIASADSWDHARVPIKTNRQFTVIIEAKTHSEQKANSYVRVDSIEYEQSLCALQPSNAEPATTTTTTPTVATTTTTTTTTTTATTAHSIPATILTITTESTTAKSSEQGRASGQTRATREANTESTSPATTPITADQAASSQSQDDVITIVGAVVGVLVFVVVAVVVLLVLRRKQILFWKTCFKADKQRGQHFDVSASHNAAYNLEIGDRGETSDMKMTALDTEHRSPSLDATAPSHASDDYYNINTPYKDTTLESPNQMYANVTKPHRPDSGPQPTVTDPAEDSPYEIASDTPDCTAHQPAGDAAAGLFHCLEDDPETQPQLDTTDPYLAPDTLDTDTYTLHTDAYTLAQQIYDVPPGARTTPNQTHSAQERHQSSMMPQDEDGDYNSLDLGRRRVVEERGEGEGPGNVYCGLNEGDGDTYSEVNHHRRREVIDDQYSFF